MLADPNARAGTFGLDSALRLPFWAAAKTGTSKAMRDNWCIGFSRPLHRRRVGRQSRRRSDARGLGHQRRGAGMARRHDGAARRHARPGRHRRRPESRRGKSALPSGIEQPRREYFLKGTALTRIAAAPEAARRPRIVNPVAGSVYALDPDIPIDRQRLAIAVAGEVAGHRLLLDQRGSGHRRFAAADAAARGQHRLRLIDLGGRVVDQILFTVR